MTDKQHGATPPPRAAAGRAGHRRDLRSSNLRRVCQRSGRFRARFKPAPNRAAVPM